MCSMILIQLILLTARPRYRNRIMLSIELESKKSLDIRNDKDRSHNSKLVSQGSRTLKQAIQQYTQVQVSYL